MTGKPRSFLPLDANLSLIIGVIPIITTVIVVYLGALVTRLTFDDAFNFQVALSLKENFSYSSRYLPAQIYDPDITTNGPVQYLAAGLLTLFSFDQAKSILLALVAGYFMIALFLLSRYLPIVFVALFSYWPTLWYAALFFLGELFATASLIVGIVFLARAVGWPLSLDDSGTTASMLARTMRAVLAHRFYWMAIGFLTVAVSTKFLTILIVPLVIFPVAYFRIQWSVKPIRMNAAIVSYTTALTVLTTLVTFLLFSLQFFLSVMHSILGRASWSGWRNLPSYLLGHEGTFIQSHIMQGRASSFNFDSVTLGTLGRQFSNSLLVGLLILATIALIRRNLFFLLLFLAFYFLSSLPSTNERRLLPFSLILLAFGLAELLGASALTRDTAVAHRPGINWRPLGLAALLSVAVVTGSTLLNVRDGAYRIVTTFRPENIQYSRSIMDYRPHSPNVFELPPVVQAVRQVDGPIITSGWWQFPEVALRANRSFYDRMSLDNLQLPATSPRIYLLFDEAINTWPATTTQLCRSVIYRQATLVLCEYDTRYSLNALAERR